jgi:hypothetical protein
MFIIDEIARTKPRDVAKVIQSLYSINVIYFSECYQLHFGYKKTIKRSSFRNLMLTFQILSLEY